MESGKEEVPLTANKMVLVTAWKLLYPRTSRSASPTKEKVRRIVLNERRREWDSDLPRGEIWRCATHVNMIWCTQKELSTRFTEIQRFRNVDEGVQQTIVRCVVQDGEELMKWNLFVFKDHDDMFSCSATAGNIWLLLGNHDKQAKDANTDGGAAPKTESVVDRSPSSGGSRIARAIGEGMRAAHGSKYSQLIVVE